MVLFKRLFELGTQKDKKIFECDVCAIREAEELKKKGIKCYVKDIDNNVLIFDNYFRFKKYDNNTN